MRQSRCLRGHNYLSRSRREYPTSNPLQVHELINIVEFCAATAVPPSMERLLRAPYAQTALN